jgi:hypothetical protein
MKRRTLTVAQQERLREALNECLGIAREYRRTLGDEDSIMLEQGLRGIGEELGLDLAVEPRLSGVEEME